MAEETKPAAYFALRTEIKEGGWLSFSYADDLEKLRAWAVQGKDPPAPTEAPSEEQREGSEAAPVEAKDPAAVEDEAESRPRLGDLMQRLTDSTLSLYELIMASAAVKPVFSSIIARVEVIDPIRESCALVEEHDDYKIFAITEDRLQKVRGQYKRLRRMERGFDLLPAATLLTMVATFDSNISEVVRALLTLKPERFDSGERTIAVADVLSMSSFDELRAKLIDDEVYLFSRGGHDEQVKYIERSFHVQIAKVWKRWPDFIEIFERRNLIAHGEKQFTSRYVSICKKHGHKGSEKLVGQDIELTTTYLAQSLSVLLEFTVLLVFSVWRKQFPDEEQQAFESVNEITYRLIQDERYRLPLRILEYVLSLQGAKVSESTRLMLTVNLASAYRHDDNEANCREVLDAVDWSAVSDNYRICVAALRQDVGDVVRLMDSVVASGSIKKDDFREWPVFDFVKDSEEFRAKFEDLLGEPFALGEIKEQAVEEPAELAKEVVKADSTVR